MNKKIIAIAIATVMAAPVAMADLKISGQLGAALTQSDKNAAAGTDTDKSSREFGDSGLSKLTFDGTSGDAYARIGMDVRSIFGGGGIAGRDFYAGYKLASGSIQFGRMAAAAAGIEGDKYNATFLQARRTSAYATTCNSCNDSFSGSPVIQYKTKVAGNTINLQYDPTDNTDSSTKSGYLAASIKGSAGAIGYFASYNNAGTDGTTANNDSNLKYGVSMKMGAVKATLAMTTADDDGTKDNAYLLMADMGLGNGLSVNAGYGANKAKDTWYRVALTKSINKGASLFGGLVTETPDGGTAATVMGVGMKVKF